jgi:hypothetical protein
MTVHLHIPEDLASQLTPFGSEVENFILRAVRTQLSTPESATDAHIEQAAVLDTAEDFLSPEELAYYLNLPTDAAR